MPVQSPRDATHHRVIVCFTARRQTPASETGSIYKCESCVVALIIPYLHRRSLPDVGAVRRDHVVRLTQRAEYHTAIGEPSRRSVVFAKSRVGVDDASEISTKRFVLSRRRCWIGRLEKRRPAFRTILRRQRAQLAQSLARCEKPQHAHHVFERRDGKSVSEAHEQWRAGRMGRGRLSRTHVTRRKRELTKSDPRNRNAKQRASQLATGFNPRNGVDEDDDATVANNPQLNGLSRTFG